MNELISKKLQKKKRKQQPNLSKEMAVIIMNIIDMQYKGYSHQTIVIIRSRTTGFGFWSFVIATA